MTEDEACYPIRIALPSLLEATKQMQALKQLVEKEPSLSQVNKGLAEIEEKTKTYIAKVQGLLGSKTQRRNVKEWNFVMACLVWVWENYYKNLEDADLMKMLETTDIIAMGGLVSLRKMLSSRDSFLTFVKCQIGHCELIPVKNGSKKTLAIVPKSISFTAVNDFEFKEIKMKIDQWLIEEHGLTMEQIFKQHLLTGKNS